MVWRVVCRRSEEKLRKIPPFEFENWAVIASARRRVPALVWHPSACLLIPADFMLQAVFQTISLEFKLVVHLEPQPKAW